jgi:hypothetical protein
MSKTLVNDARINPRYQRTRTEFQVTKVPATLLEHGGEVLKVLDKMREERRERCALPAYRYNDETGLAPDQPPDWPPEANPDWDE